MERSMFFDARIVNGEADRTYGAADLAALRRAYYDDGVLSSDALAVRQTAEMSVTVAPGAAVIDGYTYVLDESKTLALSPLGAYARTDLVVLRLDLGARMITPAVISGQSAPNAPVPSASTSGSMIDLVLAKITLPSTANASIDGTLTDMRPFAAMRVMNAPFRSMIAEAIGALPTLGESELAAVRSLLSRIATSGTGAKVLCDDGHYHGIGTATERVELVRFTEPGDHTFDPAEYPSADGLYDVEVIGGGGAGGSTVGAFKRGGGGGAGACVTVSALRLRGPVDVTVGEGGSGVSATNGRNGGESSFGPVFAEGGGGGAGAANVNGGYGGETSPFFAECGKDGSLDTSQVSYLDECGAGAGSVFGAGAPGYDNAEVSIGVNATSPGTGGSGAGGPSELSAVLAGGHGAAGAVVVYGRAAISEGA